MNCCENVIVTLRFAPGGRCLDMELPAFLPVGELCGRLRESLAEMDPRTFGGAAGLRLSRDGSPLAADRTLAQAGVWDGGLLDAAIEGEV